MPELSAPQPAALLWCKSNFSFLEGASHPRELVTQAYKLGYRALALCDRDGLYGIVQAWQAARTLDGFQLITGSEISLQDGSTLLLLVRNRTGYANLCQLCTAGRRRHAKGQSSVSWDEVTRHAEGLLAIMGGPRSLLHQAPTTEDPHLQTAMRQLQTAFGAHLYLGLSRHYRADDVALEEQTHALAAACDLPVVALPEILYHHTERQPLQDVLTAIRHNETLHDLGSRICSNASHGLEPPEQITARYGDLPYTILPLQEIVDKCSFQLDELRYRYPLETLPDGEDANSWLRKLCYQGARKRWHGYVPQPVEEQLQRELDLIEELEYSGYFLTMWEIVQYCQHHGILCQGRGSAANSVVCYSLEITAIDPIRMGLLFERFLSRERAEPPDIDLDIEHQRREEVIQHVYQRYGRHHAAMVANVVRYRPRSAIRDVGKALDIPATSLDRLAKLTGHYGRQIEPQAFVDAGLDTEQPAWAQLLMLGNELLGFPRHLSIHPGGFLLGDQPVDHLVPVENASMENRTVVQWDKDDVEALGLFKVDLLGLGALTQLRLAFEMLEKHYGKVLTMATIPARDSATFDLICRGDTVGVFQIESRAQMSMLPRLRPRHFYDLVIEVSIVRPGPITGGMVHPYLRRRQGRETVTYPHPSLEPVLQKTLGIPLFQEQVMKLAMVAADYTPGEADQLRRDMAAWKKSGQLERHRTPLLERMVAKGIAPAFAERVFEQIKGFGDYGFPESHAASFALIAYATAWFKCHYHDIFTCALLNAQPMGFYSTATLVRDAHHHGVSAFPVDVCRSEWDSILEPNPHADALGIRMGMRTVKGLAHAAGLHIIRVRQHAGFATLEEFVRNTNLDQDTLMKLARAGALDCFGHDRRTSIWHIRHLLHGRYGLRSSHDANLALELPHQPVTLAQLSSGEQIEWDYRQSRHSVRGHPLSSLRPLLHHHRIPDARTLNTLSTGTRTRYAGMVICRQRPGTAKGVVFMTLEDETGFVNLVIWKKIWQQYRILARTLSLIGINGTIQHEDGVVHLVVDTIWEPDFAEHSVRVHSRDFR